MSKSTFSLPESRIARRLVVTLSVTVNAERKCINLDKYVSQALLEAANRVDVQDGSASAGKLLSHSFDHGSVEVHVGYTATGSSPAEGLAATTSANFEDESGDVGADEQADKAVTAVYQQPSQREILEQSLVHGAAAELAACPNKAAAIAEGIKTLLDGLHPKAGPAHMAGGTQGDNPKLVITGDMVSRFLAWPLPEDFAPDGGISIDCRPSVHPTGTNLLHFSQAKAMLEHCINGPKGLGSYQA